MESILQIQEKYAVDDSIKSLETYAFQPISGTQLNSAGQITIRIENQDAFFFPRRSWLQIEGKLVKETGGGDFATGDKITLTSNALLHLFDNVKYELSGQEIESVYHPGHATTILGLAKYSSNFNKGPGLNLCWLLDTNDKAEDANKGWKKRQDYIIEKSVPIGSFRFAVDLEHVFGFCEDYDKVMYGFIHTLTLVRSASSNNAIFGDTATVGKVVIENIAWMMPRVDPSDGEKYQLYKSIESKTTLDVGFRMRQCATVALPAATAYTWRLGVRSEKPRYILIGLQTDKNNNQKKNAAVFDHCKLTNIYVLLNNTRYPAIDFNANFPKHEFENLYKEFCDFARKYYGIDWLVTSTCVDPLSYKELYPIFVFDLTKQSERLQQGIVDITVDMAFEENVKASTNAYALIISDRKLKFQSDGKKMNVIY